MTCLEPLKTLVITMISQKKKINIISRYSSKIIKRKRTRRIRRTRKRD
jgi:hypothetical protein